MPPPADLPDLPDLPVVDVLDELHDRLAEGTRAILVAPPGAGKTTLVPLALLDAPWAGGRILVLEPRRLAARAAARRMAELTGTEVGGLVGYQTRDERRIGRDTRVEVLTEGILTRRLLSDPELPGVSAVLFDEVHERNLPTDLGLALVGDVTATIRPDLRVLAMSATPDTERLAELLGDAPVVESEGRAYDVEIVWMPRDGAARSRSRRRGPARSGRAAQPLERDVTAAVLRALSEHEGDVLVFLPGIGEIRRAQDALGAAVGSGIDVRPLAGALSIEEQDAALRPSPAGRRRIVLATDIAETSLTVDGVRVVVDSGLAREPRFDPRTGMTRLTTVSTSRASAEQRAGRAGRVAPGAAYRLWSTIEHGSRPRHRTPEILQTDLAGLVLDLAVWGVGRDEDDPLGGLRFPDSPPTGALRQGRELLVDLGALDDTGAVTDLGREVQRLPVHPRLATMVAVDRSTLACVVATLVDERDVLRGRPDDLPADLALRVGVVAGVAGHDAADRHAVRRIRRRAEDLARRAGIDGDLRLVDPDRTGEVLLAGFPDRLGGRRRPGQFTLRSGSGAWLPDADPLADEEFVVAADLDGKRSGARIRLGAAVDPDRVLRRLGHLTRRTRSLAWDAERDDLVESVEHRLGAIRLGTWTDRPTHGPETTDALMDRVRVTGLAVLDWTPAAIALRRRVEYLHRVLGDPWPDWSVETLVATVDDWLAPYLPGATGRTDLEAVDLVTVLRSGLPWPAGAELDDLAPAVLDLPTGRTVPIDYADVSGEGPTAAVRVQDLFGTTVHPTVAGRPLRLELLSPADRPIQVTTDLPGFWAGSWADVRKDMAGRYPKHRWPEDPAGAGPGRLKDR